MKTRIWIVLALAAGLVLSGAIVDTAQADPDQYEWALVGKAASSGPNGDDDDGDGGTDVEGDPENWLGGQNRPIDDGQDDGGLPDLHTWLQGLLHFLTFGLFR